MAIDYRTYPKDWKQKRARAMKRTACKCEHCGVENYSVIERGQGSRYFLFAVCPSYNKAKKQRDLLRQHGHPRAITIVLTLAHLDHDEWNHNVSDDRLALLCQRCHFKYDRVDNEKRKKYGKHYKKGWPEIFQL